MTALPRSQRVRNAAFGFALVLVAGVSTSSSAAEIKVLVAGAYKGVLVALQPAFEQKTGHKLVVDNGTAGQLAKRVNDGEAFDVVVVPTGGMKELVAAGKVAADSVADVARVGIGVAVKAGSPAPNIGSVDAFKQALLAARNVAYIDPAAGGSSGIYLDKLFERMDIAAQVRAKAVLVPGGYVAERVVSGEADLGIHQISEILAVPGATLVGPLPAEIQNFTVYAVGIASKSGQAEIARSLVGMLRDDAATAVLAQRGMEPAGK